jgi:hypothetical protein
VIVSYDKTYTFYITKDTTITGVYREVPVEKKPTVAVDTNPIINTGTKKISFTSQYNMPSGYTLVECGLVLLKSYGAPANLDFYTPGVVRAKSSSQTVTGQYMMSKTNVVSGDTWHVKAYLVYKDSNGEVYTTYSNMVSVTMP